LGSFIYICYIVFFCLFVCLLAVSGSTNCRSWHFLAWVTLTWRWLNQNASLISQVAKELVYSKLPVPIAVPVSGFIHISGQKVLKPSITSPLQMTFILFYFSFLLCFSPFSIHTLLVDIYHNFTVLVFDLSALWIYPMTFFFLNYLYCFALWKVAATLAKYLEAYLSLIAVACLKSIAIHFFSFSYCADCTFGTRHSAFAMPLKLQYFAKVATQSWEISSGLQLQHFNWSVD